MSFAWMFSCIGTSLEGNLWKELNGALISLCILTDASFIVFSVTFWDDAVNTYKVSLSALKPYAQHCLSRSMHVYSFSGENIMAREKEICRLELDTLDPVQLKNVSVRFCCTRLFSAFQLERFAQFLWSILSN
jgi:hypothetical protein